MCEDCAKSLEIIAKNTSPKQADYPMLALKATSQYETDIMTIGSVSNAITLAASASGQVGSATITVAESGIFNPFLHRLPGIAYNAYPLIKDVSVIMSATAVAALSAFVGVLKYRDKGHREHVIGALAIGRSSAYLGTDNSLPNSVKSFENRILAQTPLGESPIASFGEWVLEGALTVAAATEVTFTIYANLGVLYGVPR